MTCRSAPFPVAPDTHSIHMMRHAHRRPPYARVALMLVALLSATLLGSVQEASCAMHGLGAVRSEVGAMPGPSHAAYVDHAAHTRADHANLASAGSHEGGHDSQGTEHQRCDCSCIGDCTMVAPLATSPSAATLRVALIDPAPRRALDLEPALVPSAEPDGLLPFANGPPASALA
jgi:hypothetical protein